MILRDFKKIGKAGKIRISTSLIYKCGKFENWIVPANLIPDTSSLAIENLGGHR